jgi:hypothetical protein
MCAVGRADAAVWCGNDLTLKYRGMVTGGERLACPWRLSSPLLNAYVSDTRVSNKGGVRLVPPV